MTAAMLDAALGYAERGWPVLPLWWAKDDGTCACGEKCDQVAKHPLGTLVRHGLKDATTDAGLVRSWWGRFLHAGIGLRTGVAFDVLDLDADDLDEATAGWGITVDMPGGPVARTGKGWHFYVAPTGRKNAQAFLDHADWRGLDGYVVAPPTRHASGRQYSWHASPHLELRPAPAELVAALDAGRPKHATTTPQPFRLSGTTVPLLPGRRLPLDNRIVAAIAQVAATPPGSKGVPGRNTATYKATAWLALLYAEGRLSAADTREWLTALEGAARSSGLEELEVRKTMASAVRKAIGALA